MSPDGWDQSRNKVAAQVLRGRTKGNINHYALGQTASSTINPIPRRLFLRFESQLDLIDDFPWRELYRSFGGVLGERNAVGQPLVRFHASKAGPPPHTSTSAAQS